MKTALIVWNVVLTLGLGFLLFKMLGNDFSEKKTADSTEGTPAGVSPGRIAFVNIDSLQSNYELFAQKKKEIEKNQQSAQALFNKKRSDFETAYMAAEETASKMTPSQIESTQKQLQQQQMELMQLQERLESEFQGQLNEFNRQLKDSLDSYLAFYNADNRFTYILSFVDGGAILYGEPALDITKDVTSGMNSRLKKN